MTAQWVKYGGSDEQIGEMDNSAYGWIVMFKDGDVSNIHYGNPNISVNMAAASKYLICEPHSYADMICQWARTGQPVWWRNKDSGETGLCHEYFPPFMHPVEFEYSFTPFEEEV